MLFQSFWREPVLNIDPKPILYRYFLPPLSLILILLLTNCGRSDQKKPINDQSKPTPDSQEPHQDQGMQKNEYGFTDKDSKAWWLEKAVRVLRNGRNLTDPKEREVFLAKSPQDLVKELVNDESFYDLMVDFNLYYLGIKSDKLKYPNQSTSFFSESILDRPQALEGALLIKEGGDYFKMFFASPRSFAKPLPGMFDFETRTLSKDPAKIRLNKYQEFLAKVDHLITMIKEGQNPSRNEFCLFQGTSGAGNFFEGLNLRYLLNSLETSGHPFEFFLKCDLDSTDPLPHAPPDITVILADLESLRREFSRAFTYLQSLEPEVYHPTRLSEVKILDTKALQIGELSPKKESISFDQDFFWFWLTMVNSSTNYNRKRASYVLKRFFCDDLTPINVISPPDHAGTSRHASEPSCQSCHYKLDPMAGFFRYHGVVGINFKQIDSIRFDDNSERSLADYANNWLSQTPSHPWKIGFIRSTTKDSLNDYGDHPEDPTFADLLPIMKRSPEVKQCLVRRLFEYFVGEKQAVDPAYLEDLTNKFSGLYATSPAAAFKETVSSLVLSKTFRTPDPASEECYDYGPNSQSGERPPCKVAAILQKNCASCHQGTGASGRLDLTRWVSTSGLEKSFPHLSPSGTPIPRAQSFQLILDRLTSLDPDLRMPLSQEIPVADRDALFLWFNSALDGEVKK